MPVIALVAMYRKTPAALRPLAQHAAVHARVRAHRVLALPAHAAAAHARRTTTSSTPRPSSSTSGRSSASCSTRRASRPPRRKAAFGNLYAAMPSLHVGWSTWSALALLPLVRRRWLKVLLCLYPLLHDLRDRRHRRTTGSSTRSAAGSCSRPATGPRSCSSGSRRLHDARGLTVTLRSHRRRFSNILGKSGPGS